MKLTQQDFERIMNIGIELSTERNRNYLLYSIVENGMLITKCDAATLYLYQNGELVFRVMRTISQGICKGRDGGLVEDMPPVPFREENVCAYTAIHRRVVNIPDVYNNREFDFSGPRNYDLLTGYHTRSILVVPVENNEGELIGVLQLINALDENGDITAFDKQYEIIIRSLGSLAAIELTNLRYVEDMKTQLRSFVEAMATAIDERTPYNGSHTRKVAEYSLQLASKINEKHEAGECEEYFDEERREKLELAALLHDIGKMVIPRSVMNRATRLGGERKALEDRFALLHCYYEMDCLRGEITPEECQEKRRELSEDLEFILRADVAGWMPEEDCRRIREIAGKFYAGTGLPAPESGAVPEGRAVSENGAAPEGRTVSEDGAVPEGRAVPENGAVPEDGAVAGSAALHGEEKMAVRKTDARIELPWLTPRELECLSIRKGTLTEEARRQMESHVVMTSKILDKVCFNRNYLEVPVWAGEHHELLDGSGYPRRLKGEEIPLEARILTIADIYDALTARDRPYKKAIPRDKALDILSSMAQEGKVEQRLVGWLSESLEEE